MGNRPLLNSLPRSREGARSGRNSYIRRLEMLKPLLDRSAVPPEDGGYSKLARLGKVMGTIPIDIFTGEGIEIMRLLTEKVGRFHYSGGNRKDIWFKWYYYHDNWSLVDLKITADYIQETMGYNTLLEEGEGRKPVKDCTKDDAKAYRSKCHDTPLVKWIRLRIIDNPS